MKYTEKYLKKRNDLIDTLDKMIEEVRPKVYKKYPTNWAEGFHNGWGTALRIIKEHPSLK